MLIKNVSALLGQELKFIQKQMYKFKMNKFKRIQLTFIQVQKKMSIDGEGLLVIPGFINAHTHIGDSIGKDVTLDSSVLIKKFILFLEQNQKF